MANLKEVRLRIASVKSTQQITKAMKVVSAAKFRKATDAIIHFRPYSKKFKGIVNTLSRLASGGDSVYMKKREVNKVLIIVITSNRGLAGAFNNNIIKTTIALINERYATQYKSKNVDILAIGKKGYEHFQRNGFSLLDNHNDLVNHLSFDVAHPVIDSIMNSFAKQKYDRVEIVYNEFKNAAVQIIRSEQLLPIEIPVDTHTNVGEYILEPSVEDIITDIVPSYIRVQFYKALLDSLASEHGARMTAMDKATDNAQDLLKALTLQYNQARQAAITNEILEIVSGANALSDA
jgi:F-type H+-transporting ATPase subunit gamma